MPFPSAPLRRRSGAMSSLKVNLDALLVREVLEVEKQTPDSESLTDTVVSISIGDLEPGKIWASTLRKPDFQRATGDWSPDTVAGLVRSYVHRELIPSLILWLSPSGTVFVIDGAHRLSALLAWVNDDYGDRARSKAFFTEPIPRPQLKAADTTRKLIESDVGSYVGLRAAGERAGANPTEKEILGRRMASNPIALQWVRGSSPENAARSFFKINQRAVAIDQTELDMIECRRKPNGIAARAIIGAGAGHRYWSGYDQPTRERIEALARGIHDAFFTPPYDEPIKTLDLPVAGHIYSGENKSLVWNMVCHFNGVTPERWRTQQSERRRKPAEPVTPLADDEDGTATTQFLESLKKLTDLVSGSHGRSLGLHPNVYFWSATGRVQSTAVLGTMEFIRGMNEKTDGFLKFTRSRAEFEEFLLAKKHYVNQVVSKFGSGMRSLRPMVEVFQVSFAAIASGADHAGVTKALQETPGLRFLKDVATDEPLHGQAFQRETKNAAFIREALDKALRCKECGARLHFRSISHDHKVRKADGGTGSLENAQLMHPFCNTGAKESRIARASAS